MLNLRRRLATGVLVCALAIPAVASPAGDGDWSPKIFDRFVQIIHALKHAFIPTPNDELTPPKP
jgi:hypothetical protein